MLSVPTATITAAPIITECENKKPHVLWVKLCHDPILSHDAFPKDALVEHFTSLVDEKLEKAFDQILKSASEETVDSMFLHDRLIIDAGLITPKIRGEIVEFVSHLRNRSFVSKSGEKHYFAIIIAVILHKNVNCEDLERHFSGRPLLEKFSNVCVAHSLSRYFFLPNTLEQLIKDVLVEPKFSPSYRAQMFINNEWFCRRDFPSGKGMLHHLICLGWKYMDLEKIVAWMLRKLRSTKAYMLENDASPFRNLLVQRDRLGCNFFHYICMDPSSSSYFDSMAALHEYDDFSYGLLFEQEDNEGYSPVAYRYYSHERLKVKTSAAMMLWCVTAQPKCAICSESLDTIGGVVTGQDEEILVNNFRALLVNGRSISLDLSLCGSSKDKFFYHLGCFQGAVFAAVAANHFVSADKKILTLNIWSKERGKICYNRENYSSLKIFTPPNNFKTTRCGHRNGLKCVYDGGGEYAQEDSNGRRHFVKQGFGAFFKPNPTDGTKKFVEGGFYLDDKRLLDLNESDYENRNEITIARSSPN